MISEETALKILPGWLGSVMRSMWIDRCVSIRAFVIFSSPQRAHRDRRELCSILPGLSDWIQWCGHLHGLFCLPEVLNNFQGWDKELRAHCQVNCVRSWLYYYLLLRTATRTGYAATFHVYTVWIGARTTNIQVSISTVLPVMVRWVFSADSQTWGRFFWDSVP